MNPPDDSRHDFYDNRNLATLHLRYFWAWLARRPVQLMQEIMAEDSSVAGWVFVVDSQLAFFEMQSRAVMSGWHAARFLARLYKRIPALSNARLHLMGHSFGGLVATNAARHLVHDDEFIKQKKVIDSLSLLEGALASNWFEGETAMHQRVKVVASMYSVYDSANGFYYPLANLGRLAAGSVGLCPDGSFRPQPRGGYASLVRPPDLGVQPGPGGTAAVDLDASRLIYKGPVSQGGAHDDIFKDDVIYLIWSVIGMTGTLG